jgi:hypothetical protein
MPHARWVELIREQERSGMTVDEFCRDRDFGVPSFHHHRARMRKDDDSGKGFMQVHAASLSSGLRLRGKGWEMDLDQDFDAHTLRRFLAVVS